MQGGVLEAWCRLSWRRFGGVVEVVEGQSSA